MSLIIDAKGKPCPQPVILAKKAITAGEAAFTMEVDNTTAVGNLQRLATSQGYEVQVTEDGDVYRVALTRTGEAITVQAPDVSAVSAGCHGDYTIFVGRDIIGDGDRELGTNLMRMFFYTLTQSEDLPRSICFMNAGAKLPAGDAQVESHLKELVSLGVDVLVCGTCLNFFGIADKLAVGNVSNMYDIVSQMQQAGKVISL